MEGIHLTKENLIEQLEPLMAKLVVKRIELRNTFNERPQIASDYMDQEKEVTAKTYVCLCDYLTRELHQLGLSKELPPIIVDKVFTDIFFPNLRVNSEPFTIDNLVLFTKTLNSIEIKPV